MPNTKSAEKRVRSSARKQAANNCVSSRLKTVEKKFSAAAQEKKTDAVAALREAISAIDKAVKTGVLKRATANRKKSRLTLTLNAAK